MLLRPAPDRECDDALRSGAERPAAKRPRNKFVMGSRATSGVLGMGSNERLIAVGVFVALALLAGYNHHANRDAQSANVAQALMQPNR